MHLVSLFARAVVKIPRVSLRNVSVNVAGDCSGALPERRVEAGRGKLVGSHTEQGQGERDADTHHAGIDCKLNHTPEMTGRLSYVPGWGAISLIWRIRRVKQRISAWQMEILDKNDVASLNYREERLGCHWITMHYCRLEGLFIPSENTML